MQNFDYDVIIVGAGPGGIFSAYELTKEDRGLKIAVFEAGHPLAKRRCPIDGERVKSCIKCQTCSIMSGFGGAGAFSDGKYNITNDFGGTLHEHIGKKKALELMHYVDEINMTHGGAGTKLYTTAGSRFKKLCIQNKLNLLDASVRHLGTDINFVVLENLYEELKQKVDFFFDAPVHNIRTIEGGGFRIECESGAHTCRECVVSVGRSGSKWMETVCHELGLETFSNRVDLGVRVELPAEASDAETTASETTEETEEAAEPEAGEETETPTDFGILTDIAGENGTTYANLFTVILDSQYDDLWLSKAAAIVGEDAAQENVDYLKGFISADIYGEEAVAAYKDAGYFMFDCWYLADVDTFTFDGDTVTTKLTDGSEQTHTYEYLGSYQLGEGEMMTYGGETFDASFPVDVYKTADDAGEFTYFLFRDDTMQTTWHIEFRYGSDLDQLLKYMEGPYAYWLSAGIDADASPETIDSVIDLFVSENLGGEE